MSDSDYFRVADRSESSSEQVRIWTGSTGSNANTEAAIRQPIKLGPRKSNSDGELRKLEELGGLPPWKAARGKKITD